MKKVFYREKRMENKEDILNAWITIEQLSEGSIKKDDSEYKSFDDQNPDFYSVFLDFLYKQKNDQNISDKQFKKSGLVFYIDIFDFKQIIQILKEVYGIPDTDEDIEADSDKFTFALYFNNQLGFMGVFYTISGYINCE